MNKLLKPPYNNWWWRRQGVNGVPFDGNPANLGAVEIYDENGWDTKKWYDNLRATRGWDDGNVDADFTMITKNSLDCMESNGNANLFYTITGDDDDPFSQLADGDISFYIVFRWDGTVNDTLLYKIAGIGAFVIKVNASSELFIQWYDGTSNVTVVTDAISTGTWHVLGVTVKNQTNDAELIVYHNQADPVSATDATFNAISFIGDTSTSRLFSNNSTSEKWDGAIAQVTVHQSIHTQEEAQAINAWLTSKWDL